MAQAKALLANAFALDYAADSLPDIRGDFLEGDDGEPLAWTSDAQLTDDGWVLDVLATKDGIVEAAAVRIVHTSEDGRHALAEYKKTCAAVAALARGDSAMSVNKYASVEMVEMQMDDEPWLAQVAHGSRVVFAEWTSGLKHLPGVDVVTVFVDSPGDMANYLAVELGVRIKTHRAEPYDLDESDMLTITEFGGSPFHSDISKPSHPHDIN